MPKIWISIALDEAEAEFTLNPAYSSDDSPARAIALVDQIAEDAKQWIRSQLRAEQK